MKKQIFILVFLVVATCASFSNSFGQAIAPMAGSAPRPLTLVTTALKPIAGKPYDYSAIINPVGGMAYWYATKATTFMTSGVRVPSIEIPVNATSIIAGTNYMTLAAAAATPTSTTVTWSSDVLSGVDLTTKPLFMVVEYNGPLCTTSNNIKVIQIAPQNAFTIDITNIEDVAKTPLAFGAAEDQCYAGILSSAWNTTSFKMENDYGVNTLYFEVIAANFTGTFLPTFKLSGLQGTQTANVDWDIAVGGAYANSAIVGATSAGATSPAQTVTTALTNTTGGVAIYVRVKVANHGYEGLTNDAITLAVDATDNSTAPNPDVNPDGTVKAAFAELALQTLKARPTVTAGTGVTFLPQVP